METLPIALIARRFAAAELVQEVEELVEKFQVEAAELPEVKGGKKLH